jgi:hypothetical protein
MKLSTLAIARIWATASLFRWLAALSASATAAAAAVVAVAAAVAAVTVAVADVGKVCADLDVVRAGETGLMDAELLQILVGWVVLSCLCVHVTHASSRAS